VINFGAEDTGYAYADSSCYRLLQRLCGSENTALPIPDRGRLSGLLRTYLSLHPELKWNLTEIFIEQPIDVEVLA